MPNNYQGLTASDVQIVDEIQGDAIVRSASDNTVTYDVNWISKSCTCNAHKYRKDETYLCKHIRGVLMVVADSKRRQHS
jgi:hypothetical protein